MKKDLNKLMKKNYFLLIRTNKHNVWKHSITGKKVTTSKTPSDIRTLKNTIRDIKNTIGYVIV